MNLQDLEKKQIQNAQKMFESHFGSSVKFEHLSVSKAHDMLERVRTMMEQFQRTRQFHRSEKNPAYLKLMIMSEGLEARIGARQQITESDVQQAQVVLAAQDFVDRVQDMLEDVSEMQFKDLPALVNSIKYEVGTSEASQFNNEATAALKGMLDNLQTAKQQLESAIGVVTGQAPTVPGSDSELDLSVDNNLDAEPSDDLDTSDDLDVTVPEPEDALSAKASALGRDRR